MRHVSPAGHGEQRSLRHDTAVLTFHRCINYGAYWQARSLMEGLRCLGASPILLNHYSGKSHFAEWCWALRPVRPTHVPLADIPRYAWKILRFAIAQRAMDSTRRFPLSRPERAERLPRLVVGSDEVWNLGHPWYGGHSLFSGKGLSAERRIAYAVSIGNYAPSRGVPPAWQEGLRAFHCVSVRDENTASFVEPLLGYRPSRVADPCLHFPIPPEGAWNGPQLPFVLVYGYGFSREFANAVRSWASHRRMALVSIGYRNDWADQQWITASPGDFAQATARAQAIATNYFHGGVFALRHRKPFVCEPTPYRAAKLLDLLNTYACESHRFHANHDQTQIDASMSEPLTTETLARIEAAARFSTNWLAQAIR